MLSNRGGSWCVPRTLNIEEVTGKKWIGKSETGGRPNYKVGSV